MKSLKRWPVKYNSHKILPLFPFDQGVFKVIRMSTVVVVSDKSDLAPSLPELVGLGEALALFCDYDNFAPEKYSAHMVFVFEGEPAKSTQLWGSLVRNAPRGASIYFVGLEKSPKTIIDLLSCGFIAVTEKDGVVKAEIPSFAIGASVGVSDAIDEEALVEAGDYKKPENACGPGSGKKRACKNCSCGLAELEKKQEADKVTVDTSSAKKSSCGSCGLGDAFRCPGCPYRGLPAFKPGEVVQISMDDDEAF